MTYKEFINFVKSECTYETIYEDSEGRLILVIDLPSAYVMVNKAKRPWVELTDDEAKDALISVDAETRRLPPGFKDFAKAIEAKLKEKNT